MYEFTAPNSPAYPQYRGVTITSETLQQGLLVLTQRDHILAQVYAHVQTPPLWLRPAVYPLWYRLFWSNSFLKICTGYF